LFTINPSALKKALIHLWQQWSYARMFGGSSWSWFGSLSEKKAITAETPGTVENTFDTMGRLVKTTRSDGSYTAYEYKTGCIQLKLYNAAGRFLYSYNYELNEDGLCRRITRSDDPQYEELTQYNADKTIARRITSFRGITRTLAYQSATHFKESYTLAGKDGALLAV
jgi:uncharacterized protein RhaS with RHS repeats